MKVCGLKGFVSDYLSGNMSDKDRTSFDSHLQSCRQCAEELEGMKEMLSMLHSLGEHKSPVNCWGGIREQVLEHERKKSSWLMWVLRPVFAAPAVALALLLAVFMMWPSGNIDQPENQQQLVATPEYTHYIGAHSGVQQRQHFTDPDITFISTELEIANVSNH